MTQIPDKQTITQNSASHATRPLQPFALPLKGNTLIEASAGTGKTYTIAMLYVRLVLGHGQEKSERLAQNLLPRDILVATFTEAATKELSDRIRLRIAQAADVFSVQFTRADDSEYADLIKFRDQEYADPSTWSACQKKLLLALEYMDEASITTLHSWCYRMLSEHAFNSGSLFNVEMLSDENELLLEAVRDYWRIHVYAMPAVTTSLFASIFASPEHLLESVKNNYKASPYLGNEPDALSLLGDEFIEQIHVLKRLDWQSMGQDLIQFLDAIKNKETPYKLNGHSANAMRRALDGLVQWSQAEEPANINVSALFPNKFDTAGFKNLSKSNFAGVVKGPQDNRPSFELVDAISALFELSARYKTWKFSIIVHASHWLNERMKARKQAKALLGFDDLISGLHHALCHDTQGLLKAEIRRQFPVVLIDEFQDTDDIQYQIINEIYDIAAQAQDTCVLFIGDPKQAIYSFRGGDIFTYLKASKAVGDNRYTLSTNYRSTKPMIDAVNHLFDASERENEAGAFLFRQEVFRQEVFKQEASNEEVSDKDTKKPSNSSALDFTKVKANGLNEHFVIDQKEQKALSFAIADKTVKKDLIAQSVATHIVELLNGAAQDKVGFIKQMPASESELNQNSAAQKTEFTRLQANDIAVLVNSKSEALELQNAFAERNLRTYFSSDKRSVLDTHEAHELLICLKAIAEPKHIASLRAAVGTPLLGQSHVSMQRNLLDENYLDELITQFDYFNTAWKTRGVLPMLREFLHYFDVQSRLLDDEVLGERILTNILHISEVLQEASLQIDGIHNLLRYYERLLTQRDDQQDIMQPRLESESGLIQIVTIHKSKGLQYPIVFLPFASQSFRKPKAGELFRYHDDDKSLQMTFTPDQDAKSACYKEAKAEEVRKLYVALTRAKHCCFVGMFPNGSYHDSALGYTLGLAAKQPLKPKFDALVEACSNIDVGAMLAPNDIRFVGIESPIIGPVREVKRREKVAWTISSYSSIDYQKVELNLEDAGEGKRLLAANNFAANNSQQTMTANDISADSSQYQNINDDKHIYSEKAFKEFSEPDDNQSALIANNLIAGTHDTNSTDTFNDINDAAESNINSLLNDEAQSDEPDLAMPNIYNFHKGALPGTFLHNILEWCCLQGFSEILNDEARLQSHINEQSELLGWSSYNDVLLLWIKRLITQSFALPKANTSSISLESLGAVQAEMEFLFTTEQTQIEAIDALVTQFCMPGQTRPRAVSKVLNGALKGFIDLVFEHEGKYFVLDYKGNHLGDGAESYSIEAMQASILSHRYDLQYVIYTLALHRLLKSRLPDYDYNTHIGGAIYYFLRGVESPSNGIFYSDVPFELIVQVDALFEGVSS